MTEPATPPSDLDEAIAALYGGRLEDFIRQRDALARAYRSAGDRTVADEVKALRKPSRMAWALNIAIINRPGRLEAFDGAVAGAIEAQGTGGDVRTAMAALRAGVRELADAAADAARNAGQNVDASALSTAILAVLGSSERLAQLRSGRLVEIPEGGGLDALAALPPPSAIRPRSPALQVEPKREQGLDTATLRADVERAAANLASARSRADAAAQVVHDAKSELAAAEQRLREAERELDAAGRRHGNALREAAVATAALQEAEAAHRDAQRKLNQGARFGQ